MESALALPRSQGLLLPRPRTYRVEIDWKKIGLRMLAIALPQQSELTLLKLWLNAASPSDPVLRLYVNNITPGESDVAATYTQMSTQGYSAKTLAGASWTFTAGNPGTGQFAQQTWTFDGTGGATLVYGYYLTQTTGGLLLYSERFSDGPYTVQNNLDQIVTTPAVTGSEA